MGSRQEALTVPYRYTADNENIVSGLLGTVTGVKGYNTKAHNEPQIRSIVPGVSE